MNLSVVEPPRVEENYYFYHRQENREFEGIFL